MKQISDMQVDNLIRLRKNLGSKPLDRSDPYKLGLVIEGGGMRGVVGGGMVSALEIMGLRDTFDVVYGASAGAICGAYFIAAQAVLGTTIYYQDINNSKFLSMPRFFLSPPMMSLSFLLDNISETIKCLDWQSVLHSPIPLVAVASDINALAPVSLRHFKDKQELKLSLKASACIPIVAGEPIVISGRRLWDALITDPIPYAAAIEDGCTHVLVLSTRPRFTANREKTLLDTYLFRKLMAKRSTNRLFSEYFSERLDRYRAQLSFLQNAASKSDTTPSIGLIDLPESHSPIKSTEKRREVLYQGAISGAQAVFRWFDQPCPRMVEVIGFYSR